jgi:SnoaL-like domain
VELWEIEARQELGELLARYYRLGDNGKIEEQADLFEPDGVVELHGRGEFTGRDAIVAAYRTLNENHVADPAITYIRHFSSNYTLEFDGPAEARGEGYWLLLNNRGLATWGRCRDWYRRTDRGPWRFVRRVVRGDPGVPAGERP